VIARESGVLIFRRHARGRSLLTSVIAVGMDRGPRSSGKNEPCTALSQASRVRYYPSVTLVCAGASSGLAKNCPKTVTSTRLCPRYPGVFGFSSLSPREGGNVLHANISCCFAPLGNPLPPQHAAACAITYLKGTHIRRHVIIVVVFIMQHT